MSGMTNPDNAMMEEQQEKDLGHMLDGDGKTGAVGAKIRRLPEGVDADGLIRGAQEMDESEETQAARHGAAAAASKAQPRRRG
ncbi:MAG: hypothetical protein DI629_08445 [Mesorhizobium amorphae]|nr:MAG: hypothetical protein DI629_08445 [Mesorhizobium amorphae]